MLLRLFPVRRKLLSQSRMLENRKFFDCFYDYDKMQEITRWLYIGDLKQIK